MNNKITVGEKELEMIRKDKGTLVDFKLLKAPKMTDDEVYINLTTTETSKDWTYRNKITMNNNEEPELFPTICTKDNYEMIECLLLNMPLYQHEDNPLTMINIANHQQHDQQLMQTSLQFPMIFPTKIINNINIVCYQQELPIEDNQWRIAIPPTLINRVIRWYHLIL